MALDWRDAYHQETLRKELVREIHRQSTAHDRDAMEAHRRRNAKTVPTYPAIAWGSLGLGGCAAFLLGLVVLVVASLALSCGMIRLTSQAKTAKPVPHQVTPKHQGHRRHEKSHHLFAPK